MISSALSNVPSPARVNIDHNISFRIQLNQYFTLYVQQASGSGQPGDKLQVLSGIAEHAVVELTSTRTQQGQRKEYNLRTLSHFSVGYNSLRGIQMLQLVFTGQTRSRNYLQ